MENPDSQFASGLRQIRNRRRLLWGLILIYVPVIWVTLEVTRSDSKTAVVFGIWCALVFVGACRTALAVCPRCGNFFHMNGIVPLYLRRCLHCGLHLCADRNPRG